MEALDAAALDELVHSEVGQGATCERYVRPHESPMSFVLDEAERQLSRKFIVYWVNGGLPEHFSLPGLDPAPVVFNSRYVELASVARALLVRGRLDEFRLELSERNCLRFIAELSLRHGSPDLAALAFMKSFIGQRIHVPINNLLLELESEPLNEAYMTTWFFGLAHELGHLASATARNLPAVLFSDEILGRALEIALGKFPHYPDDVKRTARARAISQKSKHSLGLENLRSESAADIFAVGILFQATLNILQRAGSEFRLDRFIQETLMALNSVVIVERCKSAVVTASLVPPDPDSVYSLIVHPVSFFVRAILMRQYLSVACASLLELPDKIDRELLEQCGKLFDAISENLLEVISTTEDGMAKAMRFALYPWEREPDLLDQFAHEVSGPLGFMARHEAQGFCEKAYSLGVEGDVLRALRSLAEAL